MSADDTQDGPDDASDEAEGRNRREEITERLNEETDRAVQEFDQRLVDLLSWMLDTETRARIYVNLRKQSHSTSDEIAEGTGLYPSTVREALAELHEEGIVERRKRQSEGAGNNPYEYAAIAPSDLVGTVAEQVQRELNTVFNLDRYLDRGDDSPETDDDPVTITVEDGAAEGSDAPTGQDADADDAAVATDEDVDTDDAAVATDEDVDTDDADVDDASSTDADESDET